MKGGIIKWLWQCSGGVRWSIALNCFLGIVRITAGLSFIYVSKLLIDMASGHTPQHGRSLWGYCLLLALLMVVQIVCNISKSWISAMTGIKLKNSLKHKVFSGLLFTRWNGREPMHTGDMINRLEEDIRIISELLGTSLPEIIIAAANLVAAFVFLCIMNMTVAMCIVFILPLFAIISKSCLYKIRKMTREIRECDSKIQSVIQESLQHRTLIQSLENGKETLARLQKEQSGLYDKTKTRTRFSLFARSMINIGFTGGYLVVFIWSVFHLKSGAISFGMMTAFLQLVNQLQRPTLELTRYLPAVIHAIASADRLKELEALPSSENEIEAGAEDSQKDNIPVAGVRFENVSFRYNDGKTPVLENFSYDFSPGKRIAIVGETGAGKSTIIRLMLALLSPTSGEIKVYTSCRQENASTHTRRFFAYVPQGNSLLSGTVRDNLLLGNPSATEQQMREALHTAAADFVLELPDGLDSSTGEGGAGFSEGQAQIIAIARGILRPGSILLLDEFSSSLDLETEQTLIKRLIKGYPEKTMIFITHRELILDYCSETVRLEPAK